MPIPYMNQATVSDYDVGIKKLCVTLNAVHQTSDHEFFIPVSTDGDILGAMADAVEKAAVVLVCFSQKYKDSQSCRTGKEYQIAFKLTP